MATLKKQILGEVSGSLGGFTFRGVKGKNVIGVKPTSRNIPNDEAAINRRKIFGLSTKLAAAIISDEQLKTLWKERTPYELNVHNYILQQNYVNITPDGLSDMVKLVPEIGFPVTVNSVNKTSSQLSVVLNTLSENSGFRNAGETKIRITALLYMSNPVDDTFPAFMFKAVASTDINIVTDQPMAFNISLDGMIGVLYQKYSEHKMYYAFITSDNNSNIIQYSDTYIG